MIFTLLIVAVILAAAIAAFKPRFGLQKPAIYLFVMGFIGSVCTMLGMAQLSPRDAHNSDLPIIATLGVLLAFIALVGLLVLAVLWAYRRYSGFYKEHSP